MIIKELEYNNAFSRVKAVYYAQLILNRYIFVCFAEDLGLLPGQITIDTIHRPIRFRDLRGDEIWHRINGLFRDIRDGNSERKVYPYDGVLFDEDLKFIEIRDLIKDSHFFRDTYQKWKFEEYEFDIQGLITPYKDSLNPIYQNLLTISQFDFSSDLDVNILGPVIFTIFLNGVYTTCAAGRVNARQGLAAIAAEPTEATHLLRPNALIEAYVRANQEIHNRQVCGNRVTGLSIIAAGTIITMGCVIGITVCWMKEDKYKQELEDLEEYKP